MTAPTNQISDEKIRRMTKTQLVALHHQMMRERGAYTLSGGPRTSADYFSSIMCMRREDNVRATHLAEAGPGHEQCGLMNFTPICGCRECGKVLSASGTARGERFCSTACAAGEVMAR